MDKNRGWAPQDAANEGLDSQKAAIDRLNRKSNAEQAAAADPAAAPQADETRAAEAQPAETPPPAAPKP